VILFQLCPRSRVLALADDRAAAADATRQALDRYERKGIVALAQRARERLSALQER
jgi:hypothetical protein